MLLSHYLELINKIKESLLVYKNTLRLELGDPGYVLQVRQNKHLVFEDCFGVKDQKTKAPIGPDTTFLMASLAKPLSLIHI